MVACRREPLCGLGDVAISYLERKVLAGTVDIEGFSANQAAGAQDAWIWWYRLVRCDVNWFAHHVFVDLYA